MTDNVRQITPERLREVLIEEFAAALAVDQAEVDPTKNFDEFGLDSTDAVILVGVIEDRLQMELNPELLLEHRTIEAVVQAMAARQLEVAQPAKSSSKTDFNKPPT
jgi:acyl carrier protein